MRARWGASSTRLTIQVVGALVSAERSRALAQPVASASPADLTLRAEAIRARDPTSMTALAEARQLYDKALRLDPNLTAALRGQALTVGDSLYLDPHADRDRLVREYDEMSMRVVAVAGHDAVAWNIRADALMYQWRWDAALEANAKARTIDPNRPNSIGQLADLMVVMGRPVEALTLADQALSLQPFSAPTAAYLIGSRCTANMALGRYEEAIAACERAASLSDTWWFHVHLVAAYALEGNAAKAAAEKAKLLAQRPGFSIADFKALRVSDVPAYLQQTETHLFTGLRKAGIPES